MKKKEKVIRFRLDYAIFKKYKVICAHLDLSMPKQTAELINQFIHIQEENIEKLKEVEQRGKEHVGIYN